MPWKKFKPFTDYIDIQRYTGYQGRAGEWMTRLERDDLEQQVTDKPQINEQSSSDIDEATNDSDDYCKLFFNELQKALSSLDGNLDS